MLARYWHAAIAIAVVAALIIQGWIAADAASLPAAHAVGTLAGTPLTGRMVRVISFFTIQSNILCAISSAQLAGRQEHYERSWRVVRLAGLVGITVTGIVYSSVLARIHEPTGWQQVSTNIVFHYLVPIMMVVGWLCFGPRPRIDPQAVAWMLGWPVLWFVCTLVHGAATQWYPYPFVDVSTHGYGRVVLNALMVTVVLAAVAGLYWMGDRRLPACPAPRTTPRTTPARHVTG